MPTTRVSLGLLTTLLLSAGSPAVAGDAVKPSGPASAPAQSTFARDLVAARQANAKAQAEGRPSVWMLLPAPAAKPVRAPVGE
ncbi:hypothetical protein [Methylobacterium nonmethylotrophicum]|uniref:Uncharacterized protein n=1 Tax=Methylobacterium nonmethylotrophicum TaxID=1141884 RepID=A0A4Z0NUT6_9HYPH|nr:hypothetical protein [Methylobacterium nonmethylotrophicum]TGE01306.1 hypothetical protein EU555_06850 [Methylobacterium nonmethylotrophicum]